MKKLVLVAYFAIICSLYVAAQIHSTSLNGTWLFALDPMKVGENIGWSNTAFPDKTLDKVTVPHCYTVDKRYFSHTGTAWYFKNFDAAILPKGYRAFVKFDAVFYKTNIWLNGKKVGTHEGGYTPFEIDVTEQLKQKNVLTVQVNNEWDTTTIPGAKTVDTSYRPNASQLYAWMNYGGIIKPVHLIVRPDVYLSKIKIEAEPDLQKGNAKVHIKVFVKNLSTIPAETLVNAALYNNGKKLSTVYKPVTSNINIGQEGIVELEANLPAKEVKLWRFDAPELYEAEVAIAHDTVRQSFGIRKVEVKNVQILLNGKPIKMGGGNRPTDYPNLGSLDPDSILIKDLTMMKQAGMEFSRIAHHAVSENILEWADKNGMLIITEAGNWQMTPKQMADEAMRTKYRSQLKEMIERDWNHPSVIAYSLGNEFYSHKAEGKAWVKDMKAYTKTLDTTRLITFASYMVFRNFVVKPEDEASQDVDFISANIYGGHLKAIEHIHEVYPNKPIYVSEFGVRVTPNKPEQDRINYLTSAMNAFRKCDYVVGASVWSFNDYMSRYPETDADGYRGWGVVNPQREKRGMYYKWQEEFAPATIDIVATNAQSVTLKVTARKDFPAYILEGYKIQIGDKAIALKTLQVGESTEVVVQATVANDVFVELIKPGGFVILKQQLKK